MICDLSLFRARKKEEKATEAPRRGDWQKHREIFLPLFKKVATLLSLLCAPHTSCFISTKYLSPRVTLAYLSMSLSKLQASCGQKPCLLVPSGE